MRWEENSHGRKDTVFSPETGRGKVDGSLLGRSRKNFNYLVWLGKPQKKSSPTSGRAPKRGEGVKAGPLRKKELF